MVTIQIVMIELIQVYMNIIRDIRLIRDIIDLHIHIHLFRLVLRSLTSLDRRGIGDVAIIGDSKVVFQLRHLKGY